MEMYDEPAQTMTPRPDEQLAREAVSEGEPLVSFVIPAYRAAETIERAITSLLCQTEPRVEIIVVDDCSQDGTADKVTAVGDERVQLVQFAENQGACAARNRGLDEAQGEWVGFVDADDWVDPVRTERLVEAGERVGADMVADNVIWAAEPMRLGATSTGRRQPSRPSSSTPFLGCLAPPSSSWGTCRGGGASISA